MLAVASLLIACKFQEVEIHMLAEFLQHIGLEDWLTQLQSEDIELDTVAFLSYEDLVGGVGMPAAQAKVILQHLHLLEA